MVNYLMKNHFDHSMASNCHPRKKFKSGKKQDNSYETFLAGIDNNIKTMDFCIEDIQQGFNVPVLIKKYLMMNGKVIGFNVDPDFNNCLDALVLVEVDKIPEQMVAGLKREPVIKSTQAIEFSLNM